MLQPTEERDFQQRIAQIEQRVNALGQISEPQAQANARELIQLVLDLHGTGLERMLNVIYDSGHDGQQIIYELANDELVSNLLLLHGLHPLDLESRVLNALDKVRPYMKSHGGGVELLRVTETGVVKLRLEGSCHGCPSSRVTLQYAVEEAIASAAPDVTKIEVEGMAEPAQHIPYDVIPASQLTERPHRNGNKANGALSNNAPSWTQVQGLGSLDEGILRVLDVSGMPILFCRVGENAYAYASDCPHCGQPLEKAKLNGGEIHCTACGHRYQVTRAGRDLDDASLFLAPHPLLESNGIVRVALPAMERPSRPAPLPLGEG